MDKMPFYFVLLQSLPENVILIYLGLSLLQMRLKFKQILLASLLMAFISYIIRALTLPPGINVLLQLPVLIVLLMLLCGLKIVPSILTAVLGLIGLSFAEGLFNFILYFITGIPVQSAVNDPILRLLYPIPEYIFLIVIIYIVSTQKHSRKNVNERFNWVEITQYNGVISYIPLICVLGLSVVLVIFGFYYQKGIDTGIVELSRNFSVSSLFTVIFAAVILCLLLLQKLVLTERQKVLVQTQQQHIDNLQDMMQIIKAQRHDFVNHVQVVYGLLSLNEVDSARNYISKLYGDIQVNGDILQLSNPELSALLLVKMGMATSKHISLNIQIDTSLKNLKVSSLDLVTVIGNLLNNALEAVEDMEPAERRIRLKIFEKAGYFVIQTHNPGFIPEEVRSRIFKSGFSTKVNQGDRGIGLASVKYIVEKYRGKVLVSSHPKRGTCFTVCYPQRERKRWV